MIAYLLQGVALGFSAGISPGPMQAFLLNQSLQHGWKRTWPAAFAPLLSDGPIILLVVLILLQLPARILDGLRIAGGLFLLYLAWNTVTSLFAQTTPVLSTSQGVQSLFKGALLNFLNPSPYIFWSTVGGPLMITGWNKSHPAGIAFFIGFYACILMVQFSLIALFSRAGLLNPKIVRLLNRASALFLACIGIYQIWSGIF